MKNRPKDRHEPSAKEKCQKIEQAIAAFDAGEPPSKLRTGRHTPTTTSIAMKTNRNLPKPPRRKNRGNWSVPATCPGCSKEGTLKEQLMPSCQLIRSEDVRCQVPKWVCADCGAAFMSPAQATAGVKIAVSSFQRSHGLLTADEIRKGRRQLDISTAELAIRADIGEATVKRLEAGTTVQQASTNRLLANALRKPEQPTAGYSLFFDSMDSMRRCLDAPEPWSESSQWDRFHTWESDANYDNADPAELVTA